MPVLQDRLAKLRMIRTNGLYFRADKVTTANIYQSH